MDYYRILGVNKNSTPEDIKKAYRKQVKQHHPDRGGDAEYFKRINEAYEILSNSDKRSAYDNPQPDFNFNSSHFRHPNSNPFQNGFADMFSQQFGFRQPNRPMNKDISLAATISLKDVLTGKNVVMQYRLGSGKIETVDVTIPPGAKNGDTIRFENLGDDSRRQFPRGNLNVRIKVQKNTEYLREGNDLVTKKTVNVFDILLGCVIIIKTLDDKSVKLKIPKAMKPGTILSIPGYGLPDLNNPRQRGKLLVQVNTEIPDIANEALLEEIQNIRNRIYTKD